MTAEERTLLEGCRRGDERAWAALYKAYVGDLGRYLQGMLREATEVDDLVQKVFLEFLASLDRYRGDAGLRTWLHRIARHVALHDIRGRERRMRYVRSYAETAEETAGSPESRMVARDRLNLVRELLLQVDDSFREVWVLRELQGFSVAEAAVILEIPEATVRTRHHRARRRLFKLVEALDDRDAETLEQKPDGLTLVWSKGEGS